MSNPAESLGSRVIRDIVREALNEAGISNAVAFEIRLQNGGTVTVSSADNPILDRPAEEAVSVTAKQTAAAGQNAMPFSV